MDQTEQKTKPGQEEHESKRTSQINIQIACLDGSELRSIKFGPQNLDQKLGNGFVNIRKVPFLEFFLIRAVLQLYRGDETREHLLRSTADTRGPCIARKQRNGRLRKQREKRAKQKPNKPSSRSSVMSLEHTKKTRQCGDKT
jgi:hypothetical protein